MFFCMTFPLKSLHFEQFWFNHDSYPQNWEFERDMFSVYIYIQRFHLKVFILNSFGSIMTRIPKTENMKGRCFSVWRFHLQVRICKWSGVVGNGFRVSNLKDSPISCKALYIYIYNQIILPLLPQQHPLLAVRCHCWCSCGSQIGVGAWLQVWGGQKNTRIQDHPKTSPKVGAIKNQILNPRFKIWLSSSFEWLMHP